MEIVWLGCSCFRIRGRPAAKDVAVVTDPCPPTSGYTIGKPNAAVVTISHDHSNHSYLKGVSGKPQVLDRPGEYEVQGSSSQASSLITMARRARSGGAILSS